MVGKARARRELLLAALVAAAGAGLILTAIGRTWAIVTPLNYGPLSNLGLRLPVTGSELTGALSGFAWAGLASVAALFATRGVVRTVIGALLAVFGMAATILTVRSLYHSRVIDALGEKTGVAKAGDVHVDFKSWAYLSLAGGIMLTAAGIFTALRGRRWPGMSARYGSAASQKQPAHADDPASMWKTMDRGEDPT